MRPEEQRGRMIPGGRLTAAASGRTRLVPTEPVRAAAHEKQRLVPRKTHWKRCPRRYLLLVADAFRWHCLDCTVISTGVLITRICRTRTLDLLPSGLVAGRNLPWER